MAHIQINKSPNRSRAELMRSLRSGRETLIYKSNSATHALITDSGHNVGALASIVVDTEAICSRAFIDALSENGTAVFHVEAVAGGYYPRPMGLFWCVEVASRRLV